MAQKAAPAFELSDLEGKKHRLQDFAGKILVLEWTNKDCPYVQSSYEDGALQALAAKHEGKGVQWVSIDSTRGAEAGAVKAWRSGKKALHPCLLDPEGRVGRAYGARTTPHVFIVKDGQVVYEGALDDKKSASPKGVNYVATAIDELLAGKPVSTPSTAPYGCSVKYASPAKAAGRPQWHTDQAKAMAEAKKTGRPVLASFTGSDWCNWCHKLEAEVYAKPEFAAWARGKVILLNLDFPRKKALPEPLKQQNEKLRQKYSVETYPTVVLLSANGEEIGRTGYLPTAREWIAKVDALIASR